MLLPAVAAHRHLHDLRRPLVDRGDAHVPLDLLDHVLARVAVAAEGLDRGLGGAVAGLAGEVLRDGALGDEGALRLLERVEGEGCLLDVRASRLEAHDVGNDQLVRVPLLLGEGRAGLHAPGRVGDGAVERRPAGTEAEGGDHEARVAEDRLRLLQALPLDLPDEVVDRDEDVVEGEGRRVGEPDPVLLLRALVAEARRLALHDEPARASRREREHGGDLGHAAVADPLLATVEPVADDPAALLDARGGGAEGGEIAARLGLRGSVGHEEPLLGDAGQPVALLRGGPADADRVAAEERREERRGHAHVDARERLARAVDVEGAGSHPAGLLGHEEQLHPQLGAAHLAHEIERHLVACVEVEQHLVGKTLLGEVS